jgi:hypothetical protein
MPCCWEQYSPDLMAEKLERGADERATTAAALMAAAHQQPTDAWSLDMTAPANAPIVGGLPPTLRAKYAGDVRAPDPDGSWPGDRVIVSQRPESLRILVVESIPSTMPESALRSVLGEAEGLRDIVFSEAHFHSYNVPARPRDRNEARRAAWLTFETREAAAAALARFSSTPLTIPYTGYGGQDVWTATVRLLPRVLVRARAAPMHASDPTRVVRDAELARELATAYDTSLAVPTDLAGEALLQAVLARAPDTLSASQRAALSLDVSLTYLRRVHFFDYYMGLAAGSEVELVMRTGLATLRPTLGFEPMPVEAETEETKEVKEEEAKAKATGEETETKKEEEETKKDGETAEAATTTTTTTSAGEGEGEGEGGEKKETEEEAATDEAEAEAEADAPAKRARTSSTGTAAPRRHPNPSYRIGFQLDRLDALIRKQHTWVTTRHAILAKVPALADAALDAYVRENFTLVDGANGAALAKCSICPNKQFKSEEFVRKHLLNPAKHKDDVARVRSVAIAPLAKELYLADPHKFGAPSHVKAAHRGGGGGGGGGGSQAGQKRGRGGGNGGHDNNMVDLAYARSLQQAGFERAMEMQQLRERERVMRERQARYSDWDNGAELGSPEAVGFRQAAEAANKVAGTPLAANASSNVGYSLSFGNLADNDDDDDI